MKALVSVGVVGTVSVACVAGAAQTADQAGPVALMQDGPEAEVWEKWGDAGDAFISFRADDRVAMDGRHAVRVQVELRPDSGAWPALGLELPVIADDADRPEELLAGTEAGKLVALAL